MEKLKELFKKHGLILVIIPAAYLFMKLGLPLWANIIACVLLQRAIELIIELITDTRQRLTRAKFEAIQKKAAEEEEARKKAEEDAKPLYVTVLIGDASEGKFGKYLVPQELKKTYLESYGTKPIVTEEDFNNFILTGLSIYAGIDYFANAHRAQTAAIASQAIEARPDHAVNNQRFYVSYFDETNTPNFIYEIDGKPITEEDVNKFHVYCTYVEKIKPGERYMKKHFDDWLLERKEEEFRARKTQIIKEEVLAGNPIPYVDRNSDL